MNGVNDDFAVGAMDGSLIPFVPEVMSRAVEQQHFNNAGITPRGSQMQRRVPTSVSRIDPENLRSMPHDNLGAAVMAIGSAHVKRGIPITVGGVDVGSVHQKQEDTVDLISLTCQVQGSPLVVICRVHDGADVHQERHNVAVSDASSDVKSSEAVSITRVNRDCGGIGSLAAN